MKAEGGTLVSQIHQVCSRVWNALLRNENLADMTGARGRVLFSLWSCDGVPVKYLCEKTSLDKATLTGVLDRLERDGYILRKQDDTDKRRVLVWRTGKDDFFSEKIPAVSDKMNAVFYNGFSVDEIQLADSLLRRILQNCKDAEQNVL